MDLSSLKPLFSFLDFKRHYSELSAIYTSEKSIYYLNTNNFIKLIYVKHFLQQRRPKINATEHPKTAGSIIQAQQMIDPFTRP